MPEPLSSPLGYLRVWQHPVEVEGAWVITTCQRRLEVAIREAESPADSRAGALQGKHAYQFLLEVITGLQSAVIAETNVSGQVRASWEAFRASARESVPSPRRAMLVALRPWVTTLFADAALVRQRWLQGIGGTSYGTLARKLLATTRTDRVLVIGSGDLARSVVPAFSTHVLGTYSRGAPVDSTKSAVMRFGPGEERNAGTWADSVIFCTPPNTEFERAWWPQWVDGARSARPKQILHLGARAHELEHWPQSVERRTLDDLLALSVSQGALRNDRIASARAHCAQLAEQRNAAASPALRYYPRQ